MIHVSEAQADRHVNGLAEVHAPRFIRLLNDIQDIIQLKLRGNCRGLPRLCCAWRRISRLVFGVCQILLPWLFLAIAPGAFPVEQAIEHARLSWLSFLLGW